jgi:RNA polymerase sigma-70 factor (ECF subfamily)
MSPTAHGAVLGGAASDAEPLRAPIDFDTLYREQFSFVWRSLRRLGVMPQSLDDASQEVFLVVHRRFAELPWQGSARACLFGIAQRVASDQRRWQRRKGHPLSLRDEPVDKTSSPLDQAMQQAASDIVLEFLAQLDEARRVTFILSELEQMTAPEIAQTVAANLNTVYYRIASARKAFAAFVAERCPDSQEDRHG